MEEAEFPVWGLSDVHLGVHMATVKVSFVVSPKKLTAFFLEVGLSSVELMNGSGSIRLESRKSHTVIWRMVGNGGGSLGISYTVEGSGSGEQVLVKESKIRGDKLFGVGFADISL